MPWDQEQKAVAPLKTSINVIEGKVENLELRALSYTPEGFCKVVGIWVDPITYKLIIQYDDEPIGGGD